MIKRIEGDCVARSVLMVETGGWGGIGHYAHCLSQALVSKGAHVRLVTHADHYQLDEFDKNYAVEKVFKGDGFIADWKRLYQAWKGEPIIHFQSLLSTRRDWLAFVAMKWLMPKVKMIVTAHNVLPHEVALGEKWAYKKLYMIADGIIVHSNATQKKLCKMMGQGFRTPVEIIPHGHYGQITGEILPDRATSIQVLGLDKNFQYMVCFGAIRPYKGIDLLMKAVAKVKPWPADLKVLVIGHLLTGVAEEELIALRHQLGLEDIVRFDLRYVPEDEIPHIFSITDVSLLPYRNIDQSGILMAALAAGKPILCTPVGAFPEIIKESFGFLSDAVSVDAIASSLTQAIEQRSQWDDMGRAAKKVAMAEYGWDSIAGKTLKFYDRVSLD